ncbi:hypothetical protein T484DRAFT_1847209 [Baffinella frigidus]|nr:hypothetical protein T484DRAFT_1847209 [Cryptophyta sp. CCMP2293]
MTGSLAPTRRLLSHGSPLAAAAAAAAEAAAARNPLFRAEITRVRDIADVRILRLKATRKVEENLPTGETRLEGPFAFQAGQWVDFMAPGVEKVGGFTITSAPISTPGLAEVLANP